MDARPSTFWVLLAVGASSLLATLNASATNLILPLVGQDFGAPLTRLQWVVTIYLLGISGLLLSFGRLGDIRGYKRVFLWGFALFTIAGGLCGLAWSVESLVALRLLQAIGGAMIFANSPAILLRSFPPDERGKALGMLGTLTYLGLMLGPLIGGALSGLAGWRSVFLLPLPLGLAGLALAWKRLPADVRPEHEEPFDWPGATLFSLGLVLLLLALGEGANWGWGSVQTLGLAAVALVVLVAFVLRERRAAHPMLNLGLFGDRTFATTTASALLNYVCVYAILFLMPFYLLSGLGLSPSESGLLLTAQPLVMAVVAPISGWGSDRIGTTLPATVGMIILAGGLALLSRLGPGSSHWAIAGALMIAGLGTGMFVSPNNSAMMGAAPPPQRGVAGGVLATARNTGMMLGVAFTGAIYATVLARGGEGILFSAVSTSFLAAAGVAALGAVTSLLPGKSPPRSPCEPQALGEG